MDCNTCKERRKQAEPVPFQTHEADMARMERSNKRLWISNLVLTAVIIACAIGFLVWRDQWEISETTTIEAEQQSEDGNNYAVGGDFEWHGSELE